MNSIENTDKSYFERFSFGDSPEMADELLALVLAGKKTATVSVVLEDEQTPSVGDLSLVLDGHGNPACVIKTVHLETVKFCDLTWYMVKLEGEDETLNNGSRAIYAIGHETLPSAVIPLPIKHLSLLNALRLSRCYNEWSY